MAANLSQKLDDDENDQTKMILAQQRVQREKIWARTEGEMILSTLKHDHVQ